MTTLTIGGFPFECVRADDADFSDVAAVYVILCVAADGSWTVLDVGQSGEVGTRIDEHDRRDCWEHRCPDGHIWVCVHRMPSAQYSKSHRLEVERRLRLKYEPPCGER